MKLPRVVISATSGSSAKTLVSLGLLSVWRHQERRVTAFKKGPDYIDAAWLSAASRAICRNLDVHLMGKKTVQEAFFRYSQPFEGALIEGNRGLFDGMDSKGTFSTAELAKLINAPVILIVDCRKMTGTTAAIVLGCQQLSPELNLAGVILNRIASPRHEQVARQSVEHHTGIPVVGSIRKLKESGPQERYLGLLPVPESGPKEVESKIFKAASAIREYVDYERIWDLASLSPPLTAPTETKGPATSPYKGIRCGVVRDEAFQFYYPENIEALESLGAEVVEISALRSESLLDVDALYLGGGFPEQFVEPLSSNKRFLAAVKAAAEKGLPIYGECGGAMYLSRGIWMEDKLYPMADIFPVEYVLEKKPVGHGYTELAVDRDNPFYPRGTRLRGHEFHYSKVENWGSLDPSSSLVFSVKRGFGFDGERDGLSYKNTLATYTHLHALGEMGAALWADALLGKAKAHRER